MVWASRRTCIHDPRMYELILKEDDYRLVRDDEQMCIRDSPTIVVVRFSQDLFVVMWFPSVCV